MRKNGWGGPSISPGGGKVEDCSDILLTKLQIFSQRHWRRTLVQPFLTQLLKLQLKK